MEDVQIARLEEKITAGDKLLATRLRAFEQSVTRAGQVIESRLVALSGMRDQIDDERRQYATTQAFDAFQREYRAAHEALQRSFDVEVEALKTLHNADIKELRSQIDTIKENNAGLLGRITGAGVIVVLLSLALQVIFFVITHQ